jgi:hypothetical protein
MNEASMVSVWQVMRTLFVTFLGGVLACNTSKLVAVHDTVSEAAAPIPPPVVVIEAGAPPATPPPLDTAACAAFTKRATAAAKTLVGDAAATSNLVGFCAPTPGGSWRIDVPTTATLDRYVGVGSPPDAINYALEALFVIEHVDGTGKTATYELPKTLSEYGMRTVKVPVLYDFDNDGEPELYLEVREEGDEGHHALENGLLTYDGTAIRPYKPAAAYAIETLEDVDGDGRPDLKILAKYTDTTEGCWAGFPDNWPKPMFVAHSHADGTFQTNDAEATAHVKRWCPAAPSKITKSTDAICARMWAKTPDEIAAARKLVTSCGPRAPRLNDTETSWCEREKAQKPQPPGAAEDCERSVQWFDRTPPLTLP